MDRLSGNKVKYGETFESSFNIVCDYLQPTLRSFECLQICENIYATVLKECLYNNYILCLNLDNNDVIFNEFLFNCIYKSLFFKNRECYEQYCKLCTDKSLKSNLNTFIRTLKNYVVTKIGSNEQVHSNGDLPVTAGSTVNVQPFNFEHLYIPNGKVQLGGKTCIY